MAITYQTRRPKYKIDLANSLEVLSLEFIVQFFVIVYFEFLLQIFKIFFWRMTIVVLRS